MGKKAAAVALSSIFDALTIILMILAGRFLGDADFGILNYAQSLALVVLGVGNAGLAILTVRDVARDPADAPRYFSLVLPCAAFLTALSWLAMAALLAVLLPQTDPLLPVALLIGAATYFRALVILLRSFFRGLQRFDREALAVGLENLFVIGGGAGVLLLGNGLIVFSFWLLFGRCLGFVIHALLLWREIPLRVSIDLEQVRPIARAALPIGSAQFVFMTITHVDTLILGLMVSFSEVGQFSAAFKIYWGLMLVPTMVNTILTPALAERLNGAKGDFNAYLLGGLLATISFGLGAILIGVPLAGWGINLLYGGDYGAAVQVMKLLLFACLPAFAVFFLRNYLVVIDHRRALILFSLAGLGLRVSLNFLLIPALGINGAATAILISESLIAAVLLGYLLHSHFALRSPSDLLQRMREVAATFEKRN